MLNARLSLTNATYLEITVEVGFVRCCFCTGCIWNHRWISASIILSCHQQLRCGVISLLHHDIVSAICSTIVSSNNVGRLQCLVFRCCSCPACGQCLQTEEGKVAVTKSFYCNRCLDALSFCWFHVGTGWFGMLGLRQTSVVGSLVLRHLFICNSASDTPFGTGVLLYCTMVLFGSCLGAFAFFKMFFKVCMLRSARPLDCGCLGLEEVCWKRLSVF